MFQTNAVNAHNIMALCWYARCLLYIMGKHLDLFLLKTLAKVFTHAILMPEDCARTIPLASATAFAMQKRPQSEFPF